jgi:hypothetical protein
MSDAFEKTLARSLPQRTPPALDERVFAAAERRLAAHRRRRWRIAPLAAAAAALVVAIAIVSSINDAPRDASLARGPFEIALAGGTVTFADGSLHDGAALPEAVGLVRGKARCRSVASPVVLAVAGGRVRLARGEMQIEVAESGDDEMVKLWQRAGIGGAVLAGALLVLIELESGDATLELGGTTEHIEAPATKAIVLEAVEKGGVRRLMARPGSEAGPSTAETWQAAAVSRPVEVWAEGLIVDSATQEPLSGARVGLASWSARDRRAHRFIWRGDADEVVEEPAGAVVWYAGPGAAARAQTRVETQSDAAGRFALVPPVGTVDSLIVEAAGYATTRVAIAAGEPPPAPLRIAVDPIRRLRGRVLEPSGLPFRAALARPSLQVQFALAGSTKNERCVIEPRLAGDATFAIELGAVGEVDVSFWHPGYPSRSVKVSLQAGDNDLTLTLKECDFVAGRVVRADGSPVAGVNVVIMNQEPPTQLAPGGYEYMTTTPESGFFRLMHLGKSNVLTLEAEGFGDRVLKNPPINTEDQTIVLERLVPAAISGRVMSVSGVPIANALVRATRKEGSTLRPDPCRSGADGCYRFDGLRPGRYSVTYVRGGAGFADGLAPQDGATPVNIEVKGVEVAAGKEASGVDIVVSEGGVVFGRVLDSELAKLHATVSLVKPHLLSGGYDLLASRAVGDDGRFEFTGIPAGSYAVVAGYGKAIRLVKVREGERLEVDLDAGKAVVTGRILRNGKPVVDASIAVGRVDLLGAEAREARTDSDGTFKTSVPEAGKVVLRVVDVSDRAMFYTTMLAGAGSVPQAIAWPAGVIEGEVLGVPLDPESSVSVTIVAVGGVRLEGSVPEAQRRVAETAAAGGRTFRIDGIGPGEYVVSGRRAGLEISKRVTVGTESARVALE